MIRPCLALYVFIHCTSTEPSVHNFENRNESCPVNGIRSMTGRSLIKTLLEGYDKNSLPSDDHVQVTVEVTIQDIPSISQNDGQVKVDLFFSQIWNDPSLKFNHLEPCRKNLSLDHDLLDSFWMPNVSTVNSKSARVHLSPAPNVLLLIFPNGTVWLNYRVQVDGPCNMDLSLFPMDVQECFLIFESYAHNYGEVRLDWQEILPITFNKSDYVISEFRLLDIKSEKRLFTYQTGVWDQLIVVFSFKRRIGFYILQAYIPAYVCIVISWGAFYLDIDALPARITLGVSNLMALIVTFGNVISELPRVSYLRAFDVWMCANMLFIFGTLVELVLVAYADKKKPTSVVIVFTQTSCNQSKVKKAFWALSRFLGSGEQFGNKVDAISAKLFPLAFITFNVFYWSYYLYKTKN